MNNFILSPKTIPDLKLFHQEIKIVVPEFDGFLCEDSVVTVLLTTEVTSEIVNKIEMIIPPHPSQLSQIKRVINSASNFGMDLMNDFAAENVIMGITQDGMTGTVRKACSEVIDCLVTGSLYDAIKEVKSIPLEKKDSKYLTNARLTIFINKIETYLGIPLTVVTD